MLLDESYLANIIDHLDEKYFNNKDISAIVRIVIDFYNKRSTPPTLTEIKGYLIDETLKKNYRNVIKLFENFDKKFNKEELYENTERFLKERAVYSTLLEVAEQTSNADIDTSSILNKFEKACGITLSTDLGLDYFDDIDKHINDLILL